MKKNSKNCPECPRMPDGPEEGFKNFFYLFSTSIPNSEEKNISFKFDWGDNTESEWSSYGPGHEDIIMGHQYSEEGKFEVRAIAKNKDDLKSEWSEPLTIEIYGKIGS